MRPLLRLLTLALLLGSAGVSFALPPCPADQRQRYDNCFGTATHANGDKYVGEWRDDKRTGQGTFTFANGDKYVGEFRDDNFHGQGTATFANGDKYVGEFRDDKRTGQGTYTFANGRKQEGIWKDNKFQYAQKVTPPEVARESPSPARKTGADPERLISASSGSGFAVSSDGHVITNYHVIEGCQNVKIHHNGNAIPATVVTFDPQNDLALLKGSFRPSKVLALSNSRPELLQDIYVAGFPFGQNYSTGVKVTKGIISALTGIGNNFSEIQIDAALQPGNSGGPILDDRGNVVGVAVGKLDVKKAFERFGALPENINFGIKTSLVKAVLDSKNVSPPSPNQSTISKTELSRIITDGTYFLSCWMTTAQIEKMRSKKVLFEKLD